MKTEQTFSTRDLAGTDTERVDEPRGDDDRDAQARVDDDRAAPARMDDERADGARAADDRTRGSGPDDRPVGTADVAGGDDTPQLLERDDDAEFQRAWQDIQTGFVDSPRETV